MNKLSLIAGSAAVLGLALPLAAFAQTTQTYEYVNTNGIIEEVNATSADQALVLAPDIAPHSGVLVVYADTTIPAVNTPAANPSVMTSMTSTNMNRGTTSEYTATST